MQISRRLKVWRWWYGLNRGWAPARGQPALCVCVAMLPSTARREKCSQRLPYPAVNIGQHIDSFRYATSSLFTNLSNDRIIVIATKYLRIDGRDHEFRGFQQHMCRLWSGSPNTHHMLPCSWVNIDPGYLPRGSQLIWERKTPWMLQTEEIYKLLSYNYSLYL